MKTADLIDELEAAVAAVSAEQMRWFAGQGIDGDVRKRSGPLGRVRLLPDDPVAGLYTPIDCDRGDEGAIDAVVHAVLFWPADGCPEAFRLLDMVAWNPHKPEQWWLRCGGGVTWLGAGAVLNAGDESWDAGLLGSPRPDLRLYPTPLDWLRAGARNDGAVLLDAAGRLWRDVLAGVEKVIVEDVEFAAAVYKQIRKRPPVFKLPEVWVDNIEKHEAAA